MDNKKIEEENAKNDNGKATTENKKKRKVLVNKAKKACFNCKKSHRKCEDSRPCENCKKAGLRCYDTRKKLPHELNLPPINNGCMHPTKNMGYPNPNMMHNHHPNNLPIKYNHLPNHPHHPIKGNMAPPLKMGPGKNFYPNNPNVPFKSVNMFPMNPMHFNNLSYVNGQNHMNGVNYGNGMLVQPKNGIGKVNTNNGTNSNYNENNNNISMNKNIINNNNFNGNTIQQSNNNNYHNTNQIMHNQSTFENSCNPLPIVPSNTPLVTNLNSMGGRDSLFLNNQEDISNIDDFSMIAKASSSTSPSSPDNHPISPSHDIIPFNHHDDQHPQGVLDLFNKDDIFNLIGEVAMKKEIAIQHIDQKQFFENLIPNISFDPNMFLNSSNNNNDTNTDEQIDPKEFNFDFDGDVQLVETTSSNKRLKLESLEDFNELDNDDFFDLLMNGSDQEKDERYFKKYALYFPTIPPIFLPFSALKAGTMFSMVSWDRNLPDDGFHPANMFIEDVSISMARSMGYNPSQLMKRLTPICIDYSPQQLKQYSKDMLELAKQPVRYYNLYTCLQHHTGLYVSVEISCALFSENGKPSMMFSFVKNTRLLESIAPERHKPIFELINT